MKFELVARGKTARIDITDTIGLGGYSASDMRAQLESMKGVSQITVRASSAGGEILEGLAMYNMLKDHPAKVRIEVIGVAGSMMSVIAMAGDEIAMAENSFMMIHDPAGGARGSSAEMRDTADLLDKMRDMIASIYAKRTGKPVADVTATMAAETWMTAAEALAAGYCTEIMPANRMVALAQDWKNAPAALRSIKPKKEQSMKLVALISLRGKALKKKLTALMADDLAQVCSALGLKDDANLEQVAEAIAALQNAAKPPKSDDDSDGDSGGDDDGEGDQDGDEKSKAKAQAARILADSKLTTRLDRLEKNIESDARDRIITNNAAKFSPATEKLARKWPLDVLREFVAEAPDLHEGEQFEPEGPRARITGEQPVALTPEELKICKLTGKDPTALLDFKKKQAEKRKAG